MAIAEDHNPSKAQARKPLVKVEWFDTVQSSGWDTVNEVNIMKVHQIGWFLNASTWSEEGVLKLADTIAEDEYYGITAIPKGCVHRVVSLSEKVDVVEVF
jgi:hypothetical protein